MERRRRNPHLTVLKFGGTSLATPKRIRRAAQRVRAHRLRGRQVVVVVSALGHTTDRILRILNAAAPDASARAAREADRALATGEDLAAATFAATLIGSGVPAVSLRGAEAGLIAIGAFGHADLHDLRRDHIESLLRSQVVPVVAGFQAVRPDGQTVTIGRGGSDTSAVFLAGALGAAECHIITDVNAVYDDDPRTNPAAAAYDELSFVDLIRLVDAGAQVVHPRAARYARDFRVPLHVYGFRSSLQRPGGTVVGAKCIAAPAGH